MKTTILQNWTILRVLRLLIGIAIIVQAGVARDILLGAVGLLFSGMALLNVGCCGTAGCATPPSKTSGVSSQASYDKVVQ